MTFNVSPAAVAVTFGTNPAGLGFSIDGTSYTASQVLNATPGAMHTLSAPATQPASGGGMYVFASWSDGGAMSHTITVPNAATSYTASYNLVLPSPAISFTVPKKHDFDVPFLVSASSNSSGTLTYKVDSGPASVSGSPVTLMGTAGRVTIEADQAATTGFASGTQQTTFAVTEGSVLALDGGATGVGKFDLTGLPFTADAAYTGGGLASPSGVNSLAVGAGSTFLVANAGTAGVSLFSGDGMPSSGSPYPVSKNPGGLAVDGNGQAWLSNGDGTVAVLSSTGASVGGAVNFGNAALAGLAIDVSGNVWIASGSHGIVELLGAATPTAPLSAEIPASRP